MAGARGRATHYWLSTLPDPIAFKQLVANAKVHWMIERDYEELKSELGLSHHEGRPWRGFSSSRNSCIAAYGFPMLERPRWQRTPFDSKNFPYPKVFARAAGGPLQRHVGQGEFIN